MKSFFKKARNESASYDVKSSVGVRMIRGYYLFVQDKWAKKMSSLTARFSTRTLTFLLVLFVMLMGGLCIGFISGCFSKSTFKRINIIPVSKPAAVTSKSIVINFDWKPITKSEFRRIAQFRMYLDSLARSPTGKVTYDSLYRYRKGLIDSLVIIENYYKSNLKN
jgi:hypothetical protein